MVAGALKELEGHPVGVLEVDEGAPCEGPVRDEQGRRQELDPLGSEILVGRVDVWDVDADVRRADVGVRPLEGVLALIGVAQELEHAAAESKEGKAEVRILDTDRGGELGTGAVRDELP